MIGVVFMSLLADIKKSISLRLLCVSLILFLLFIIPPCQTFANDTPEKASIETLLTLSLEELIEVEITVATGSPKPIRMAPAVASVITAADIERMGATTLDEALESVPGLHVETSGALYFTSIWSIRGIHTNTNPQVLLLINGVPFKDPATGTRNLGFQMSVSMISRVEIIRGPGSAVHGADAFAGVVNVITKNGKDINGTKTAVRVGSFDTYGARLQHGGDYGGWEIAGGIEWQKSQGDDGRIIDQDVLGSGPPSLTPAHVDTRYKLLDGHLNLKKDNLVLRMYGSLQNYAPGLGAGQAVNYGSDIDGKYFLSDFSYNTGDLIRDWDLGLRLWYEYMYHNEFFQILPASFLNMRGNPILISNITGLDTSAYYSGFKQHRIRFGAGISYTDMDTDQYKNWGPGIADQFGEMVNIKDTPYVFLEDQQRRLWYVLAQDEWSVARDWELTLGVRYDNYDDFGDTINPRAALAWEARKNLITKLLYGRAFRPPSFAEQHNKNNPVALGNENLDPETIETMELVFDYRPVTNLRTLLNLFVYEIEGLIEFAPDPAPATTRTAQNARDQEGYGFEIETDWQATSTLRVKADFAFQRSKDKSTKARVPDAPGMQLHINPQWSFAPDWTLDAQFYWIGDRHRASGDTRPEIDDYGLVHLTLRRKNILKHFDLAFAVRNLFDEDARIPSDGRIPNDYPMEGRSIWGEVRYTF